MIFTNFKVALILTVAMCLTLGLAPFNPEPHLVGKIRWLLGGGVGMTLLDYLDLLLHGLPWLALVILLLSRLKNLVWRLKQR